MDITVNSERTKPVNIVDSYTGMVVYIMQDGSKDAVEMSIDQAAKVAVEILNHVQEMQDKYLKKG